MHQESGCILAGCWKSLPGCKRFDRQVSGLNWNRTCFHTHSRGWRQDSFPFPWLLLLLLKIRCQSVPKSSSIFMFFSSFKIFLGVLKFIVIRLGVHFSLWIFFGIPGNSWICRWMSFTHSGGKKYFFILFPWPYSLSFLVGLRGSILCLLQPLCF